MNQITEKQKSILSYVGVFLLGCLITYAIFMTARSSHKNMSMRGFDGEMRMEKNYSNKNEHDSKNMQMHMSDMTSDLMDKKGKELDEAFLKDMIVHHQGAIDMAKLILESGEGAELKVLAQDIITAQEKEINQMKAWQEAWFK